VEGSSARKGLSRLREQSVHIWDPSGYPSPQHKVLRVGDALANGSKVITLVDSSCMACNVIYDYALEFYVSMFHET
jgi:hypothetical protein